MRGFSTNAIHAGQEPDPSTGAVIPPVHLTSTFAQDGVGGLRAGYEYSRSANPTRTALQECLAALEGGRHAVALGSDVVLHSTTKYVGGHSDVVGGALVTSDDELAERLRYTQNAVGSIPGPFDAWLTLRGAKTLAVRMERHCDNAERIADLLAGHRAVGRVYYPG